MNRLLHPTVLAGACGVAALVLSGWATARECPPTGLDTISWSATMTMPDDRSSRVTVWQPTLPGAYPLIVFSHGAFSAPARYEELLRTIAAAGYVVAAPLHIDSELLVDGEPPPRERVWQTRKEDLERLQQGEFPLEAQLRSGARTTSKRIAAGHSYGAFGAQVLGGAHASGEPAIPADRRVAAVIAFSPPGPLPGFIEDDAWNDLDVPQLVLTGTADVLPGFIDDWPAHAAGYQTARPGNQWLWVGEGVDHYFGRLLGRLDRDVPAARDAFDAALSATRGFLARYAPGPLAECIAPLEPESTPLDRLERR